MTNSLNRETRVMIDSSVFIAGAAFARLSGYLSFYTIPFVGDSISLPFKIDLENSDQKSGMALLLTVQTRTLQTVENGGSILLGLSAINLKNEDNISSFMRHLENDYDLFWEVY